MTVSNSTGSITHIGNSATTVWSYNFLVLEASHMQVSLFNTADSTTTVLGTSAYSVTGITNPSGGTVTYPLSGSPITSQYKLIIERIVPFTQLLDISNQDGFHPEVVEEQFDLTTMMIQQLNRSVVDLAGNPTTDYIEFDSAAQLQAATITSTVSTINIRGYTTAGDGGRGLYARSASEPSHPGKLQNSVDSSWWELKDFLVRPEMYGAVGDGTTDDTTAMQNMAAHARARGYLLCSLIAGKTYTYTVPQFLAGIKMISIQGNGANFKNIFGTSSSPTSLFANAEGLVFPSAIYSTGFGQYPTSSIPLDYGQLIDTVAAGSATVTVSSGEGVPDVTTGDRVLIYGYDGQNTASTPPNPRKFEYATVTGVSSQVVTLDREISFAYDADWPEDTGNTIYGKPRLLDLNRGTSAFEEIAYLHLKDLNIVANSAWTHAGGTDDRNGRLTIGGCQYAFLENCDVAGGMYPSQSQYIHIKGGQVQNQVEADKIIERLRYEDWKCPKGHTLGTGVRFMEFEGCQIGDTFNATPIHTLSMRNTHVNGEAEGSSAALIGLNNGTKKMILGEGTRFNVHQSSRNGIIPALTKNITITVVDTDTISVTSAAWRTSQLSRCVDVGDYLFDVSGYPAMRITRIYESGSDTRLDGVFLQALSTSDVLYAPLVQELDYRGAIFEGPYAHQIEWVMSSDRTTTTDQLTRVYGPKHGHGVWKSYSEDYTSTITADYVNFGRRISITRAVVHVYSIYTGGSGTAQLLLKDFGGSNWAIVDLKTAGRRVLDVSGNYGSAGTDTLTGLPTGPISIGQIQANGSFTVASEGEAARWVVQFEGMMI